MKHILVWMGFLVFLLPVPGCMKSMDVFNPEQDYPEKYSSALAIGTLASREGTRIIRLDPVSVGFVVNPSTVGDIADGTRVFLKYDEVSVTDLPSFCTEALRIDWVSPVDVGTVVFTMDVPPTDPVDILTDWMTSLEDGFLTLHYRIPASGRVQHGFSLGPGGQAGEFVLYHYANGDTDGDLTDGLICFPVGDLLPDTGGEVVTLSLTYLNLKHTQTRLTVDYRSPK